MLGENTDDQSNPELPGLTVAAVARRLGVAAATLRTWDRRYDLGPSEHKVGTHRRYSPQDVARLEVMRRLVNLGITPADAAREALRTPDQTPEPDADVEMVIKADPAPDHDGQIGARGLARAAASLDTSACVDILLTNIDRRGVIWVWDSLIAPVLIGIGARWHATGRGVDAEHVLSHAVSSALAKATTTPVAPTNARSILLTTTEDEQHSLPLMAIAAALSERQLTSTQLGGRVPRGVLLDAARRIGPSVIFVWAQMPDLSYALIFEELTRTRPAPVILIGGPGWSFEVPDGVQRVFDLSEAVSLIVKIGGG